MIASYKIVTGSPSHVEAEVKKLLSEGYQPHGGLGVASGSTSDAYTLIQAMVKNVSTYGHTGPR